MRATLLLLFAFILTGVSSSASAQADSTGYIPRRNLVKVGITSSIANTIALSYERVLNPDWSVALTVSYMLPLQPSGLLDLSSPNLTFSQDRTLSGYYITPEVKWFLEKSDRRPAPRGLYLGAYLRYSDTRYKADISAVSINENVEGTISTKLQIDLMEFGVGPSLGYQFLAIHDRLVVDCLFFAPRWSVYRLKVKADLQGDGELASDLGQAIEDRLGRALVTTSIDLSTTGTTTIDRNSLGYRYGIKLGYAF
jgi:hypothetical protein